MPSTPAATSITPPITEPAELEVFANLLVDSLHDVQDELDEAEAHLDYLESTYRQAIHDAVPLPMVAETQALITIAIHRVDDLLLQRTLVAQTLRSVLEQLPEED
jgi:hypothetical protein